MNKLIILYVLLVMVLIACDKTPETKVIQETKVKSELIIESGDKKKKPKVEKQFDWNKTLGYYGLSKPEIKKIKETMNKVGIDEVSIMPNNYKDCSKGLCAFRSSVYGSENLQLNFTLEDGKLFYVALAGVPDLSKKVSSTITVPLYHDVEGGYLNIYNHKENAIIAYRY